MSIFKELYNKLSGTGRDTLQVTTTESTYFGREPKYGTLKVTSNKGVTYSTVSLKLNGYAEFIAFDRTRFAADESGYVTITGTANVQKLYLSSSNSSVNSIKINGINQTAKWNGVDLVAVPGDPGATDAFNFEIQMLLTGNSDTVTVSSGTGKRAEATIYSSGSALVTEYIRVSGFESGNSSPAVGKNTSFNVDSNVSWYISHPDWISVSPESDSDNKTVSVTVERNTGRASRSGEIQAFKRGDSQVYSSKQTVSQEGAGLDITISPSAKASVDDVDVNDSVLLRYTGKCNGNKFTNISFSPVGATAEFYSLTVLGTTYSAGEVDFPSEPIALLEDDGADEAYDYELVIKVTLESGATSASGALLLQCGYMNSTDTAEATFSIAESGAEYLDVTEEEIVLESSGAAKNVNITTNVDWEIETV